MHLGVDHAGQDVQALAVDHLGGGGLPKPADCCNAAVRDGDVAHALAILIDHGAGFQNGIKSLIHGSSAPALRNRYRAGLVPDTLASYVAM